MAAPGDTEIAQVRRFNRLVTERIGALQDGYLARGRPLGASRLLWEIGDGTDLRTLRVRLGLDSGYLTRLLRGLEDEGLVTVSPGPADRRVRVATPTAQGRRERRLLDRRSDDLATTLLEPLSERQRDALVAAMGEVEHLLTASAVRLAVIDPGHPDAQACLHAYFSELNERFSAGYDPRQGLPLDEAEMRAPRGVFLTAYLRSEPVGCGALVLHEGGPSDLKRMWVSPGHRGLGLGRRLLKELEHTAREHGATSVRLETNETLVEAIAMYRAAGYRQVPTFNDERYATHWFEKPLTGT